MSRQRYRYGLSELDAATLANLESDLLTRVPSSAGDMRWYAELRGRKRVISILDGLQRRLDGWAEDAARTTRGDEARALYDGAAHVRDLIRDLNGVERTPRAPT